MTRKYKIRFGNVRGREGFTLIELLVVIAIIGLLSTAIMGPVQTGLKKGRDTRKISDITQVQGALLQYAGDNSGLYPQFLLAPGNISSSTLASTSPTYMAPDAKMTSPETTPNMAVAGYPVSAARDRFMYVTYADAAGNIVSYHLGTSLENQNASLQTDKDCAMHTAGNASAPVGTYVTTAWAEIDGTGMLSTPVATPCTSLGDDALAEDGFMYNTNAYDTDGVTPGTQAGNNVAEIGALDVDEDFGGAGTQEALNGVCTSALTTCIYDITPN